MQGKNQIYGLKNQAKIKSVFVEVLRKFEIYKNKQDEEEKSS